MAYAKSVLELIGHTPLVRLRHLSDETGHEILAKLESCNPAGSVKDRIALSMVQAAEQQGQLQPGGVIIEPTSGNTGIGLAMVAAVRGYRCILVMPETASMERRLLFQAYGAVLELTPGRLGMPGAIERADQLVRATPGAITLRQFDNPANPAVHAKTTGPEIWHDTDGLVDILVAGIGTGGTISGAGSFLKTQKPAIRIIGVEPEESAVLHGQPPGPHKIQGIGAGFVPQVLDQGILDEVVTVSGEDAMAECRRLIRQEGILAGISGGAAVCAVRSVLKRETRDKRNVVVILPDSGERYLSTALFEGD